MEGVVGDLYAEDAPGGFGKPPPPARVGVPRLAMMRYYLFSDLLSVQVIPTESYVRPVPLGGRTGAKRGVTRYGKTRTLVFGVVDLALN